MAEFKINDSAYFEEPWTGQIIGGKVIDVRMTEATQRHPCEPYLSIRIEGTKHGKRDFLAGKCYQTRKEAEAARKFESEKLRNEYRAQIQNPKDLVAFMYNHHTGCCEEYTDWDARAVVAEKAREFFRLELDG